MSRDAEAGSYSRLKDFVYHSTPGLSVIQKEEKEDSRELSLSARTQRTSYPHHNSVDFAACR